MTVLTTIAKAGPYAGAGTTGPFTVPFRFLDATHLRVIRAVGDVETVLVLGTDYTVNGVGASSGSVTLLAPLPVGQTLTVMRNVPATQEADYVPGDAFPAESHEQALDKLTMITQQLQEEVRRSAKLPASSPSDSDALSVALLRVDANSSNINAVNANSANINAAVANSANINTVAGSIANVNATGANIANVNTVATNIAAIIDAPNQASAAAASQTAAGNSAANSAASATTAGDAATSATASQTAAGNSAAAALASQAAAATSATNAANSAAAAATSAASADAAILRGDLASLSGAALVGYQPAGAGAVATNVQSKLREFVSVKDFGAVGDGVTDDTAAVAAAVAYAAANNLTLTGDGTDVCLITSSISVTSGSVKWRNLRTKSSGFSIETFFIGGTVSSVQIDGCLFDGNNTVYSHVKLSGLTDVQITNSTFKNSYAVSTCFSLWLVNTSSVLVRGNIFDGALAQFARLIYIQASTGKCSGVVISGNIFKNSNATTGSDADAVVCEDYSSQDNSVSVIGNTFENIQRRAVKAGGSNWIISGNTILNVGTGYSVFSLYGRKNFLVANNIVKSTSSVIGYVIDIGAIEIVPNVDNICIQNNTFELFAATSGQAFIRAESNVTNLLVVGNTIDYCQFFFQKPNSLNLTNAVFFGNRSTECFDHEFSIGTGTNTNLKIQNHVSVKPVASRVLVASFGTNADISVVGCSFSKTFGLLNHFRVTTAYGNFNAGVAVAEEIYFNSRRNLYRTAIPTSGTYEVGDLVYHSSPTAGGILGWVCTTAGTPGTWAPFGYSVLSGSATYDPPSLVDGAGATTTVTVTGAALGDFAEASFSLDLQGITVTAWVSAVDTVSVRFQNETGGPIDLASGTLRVRVRKT